MNQTRILEMQRRIHTMARILNSDAEDPSTSTTRVNTNEDDATDFVTERVAPRVRNSTEKQRKTYTATYVLVKPTTEKIVNKRKNNNEDPVDQFAKRKLCMPLDVSADDFKQHLCAAFPSLVDTEFQLCRCGSASTKRSLEPFPVFADCPQQIKAWQGLNRSRIYIRPQHTQEEATPAAMDSGTPTVTFREQPIVIDLDDLPAIEFDLDGLPATQIDLGVRTPVTPASPLTPAQQATPASSVAPVPPVTQAPLATQTPPAAQAPPVTQAPLATRTPPTTPAPPAIPAPGTIGAPLLTPAHPAPPVSLAPTVTVTPLVNQAPPVNRTHPVSTNRGSANTGSSSGALPATQALPESRALPATQALTENQEPLVSRSNPGSSGQTPLAPTTNDGIDIELQQGILPPASTPLVAIGGSHREEGYAEIEAFESDFMDDGWANAGNGGDSSIVANEVTQAFGNLHMSLNDEKEVTVRRSSIVEDVLALYGDAGLCKQKIKVTFEGEEGEDLGGLSKEMMTSFWNQVTKDYFKGEHVTIPFMPLHRSRKESHKFVAMGRVLTHTAAVTETLPCRIAQTAIICIVFGDTNPDCLLEDFLLYVSPSEKYLLRKASRNYSALTESEIERLTTFFCVNGLTEQPKEEEIMDQMKAIAKSVLVDTPNPLYQLMRQGIPQDHLESFWSQLTIQHLTHVMLAQRPTAARVLSVLTTEEDLRPEEERVFYYLQEFIRSLDADDLLNFLLFVTASIHMPSHLRVSFVGTFGMQRRPVAHTCSNLLEVSTNYFGAQEFKREMRMYLSDTESYRYSFL